MSVISKNDIEKRLINELGLKKDKFLPCRPAFTTVELVDIAIDKSTLYLPTLWNCAQIAREFTRNHHLLRAQHLSDIPVDNRLLHALGEAYGTIFRGEKKEHVVNIFISEKYIWLLDAQNGNIWTADENKDKIYFVSM